MSGSAIPPSPAYVYLGRAVWVKGEAAPFAGCLADGTATRARGGGGAARGMSHGWHHHLRNVRPCAPLAQSGRCRRLRAPVLFFLLKTGCAGRHCQGSEWATPETPPPVLPPAPSLPTWVGAAAADASLPPDLATIRAAVGVATMRAAVVLAAAAAAGVAAISPSAAAIAIAARAVPFPITAQAYLDSYCNTNGTTSPDRVTIAGGTSATFDADCEINMPDGATLDWGEGVNVTLPPTAKIEIYTLGDSTKRMVIRVGRGTTITAGGIELPALDLDAGGVLNATGPSQLFVSSLDSVRVGGILTAVAHDVLVLSGAGVRVEAGATIVGPKEVQVHGRGTLVVAGATGAAAGAAIKSTGGQVTIRVQDGAALVGPGATVTSADSIYFDSTNELSLMGPAPAPPATPTTLTGGGGGVTVAALEKLLVGAGAVITSGGPLVVGDERAMKVDVQAGAALMAKGALNVVGGQCTVGEGVVTEGDPVTLCGASTTAASNAEQ